MAQQKFSCGCVFERNEKGPILDVNTINYNCPATWKMLKQGLTKGVFQLESQLGRQWSKAVAPESIEHLAAIISIMRPGTLKAISDGKSMTQHYADRKNGKEEIKPYHPAVDAVLAPTYNVLVYQEQAMELARTVGGFNLQEADMLRKAIGKKKPEEMAKVKKMFLEKAKEIKVVSDDQADEIFGWIEKSQRYSFNKCISKNTIIRRPNGGRHLKVAGYTVEEMFKIRNNISYAKATGHLSLYKKWKRKNSYGKGLSIKDQDGRIHPNNIIDIQPAGIRAIYRLTTETGKTIDVTDNHSFPTIYGKKKLSELNIGDEIFSCGEYEETNFNKYKFSNTTIEELRTSRVDIRNGGLQGFQKGENNPRYTNGSYTDFIKADKVIPRICALCSRTDGRLELHHINGDRTNSSLNNLERLCSSCHKKKEYKLGRTKRGEKGYPFNIEKITSIEYIGEDETYDVTMEAPDHNFVVNDGIVTSNSHAVSYAIDGYWSAYAKAHFPVEFFTSYLYFADEKQDPKQEIRELINEMKLFDIEIYLPKLKDLNMSFTIDGENIKFGLSDIKGIGESVYSKIVDVVKEVEQKLDKDIKDWTWYELLTNFSHKINSLAMTGVISVGALDYNMTRNRMLYEYNKWLELTEKEQAWVIDKGSLYTNLQDALADASKVKKEGGATATVKRSEVLSGLYKLLVNPPMSLADEPAWIAVKEEQLLGAPISCHIIDGCDVSACNCSCREFLSGRTGVVLIAAEVKSRRLHTIKTGKNAGSKMMFLTIEDGSYTLDNVVAFTDVLNEYGNILEPKQTVLIKGERSKNGSLRVDKVWQI